MAKLDSLIVDLQVNTASLKTGLDDAKSALNHFGEQVNEIHEQLEVLGALKVAEFGKEIGEAFLEAGKSLAEFALGGSELAEKISILAQSTGLSVTSFSQLAFAANTVGLSTDDFAKGLEKLDKNLAAAGSGSVKQAGLFNALGISVKDASGNVRSTDDVMGELAEKFSSMADGADKTALAMDVFGKAGAGMIPYLNQGKDGIEEMRKEADRLGITLTENDTTSAKAFQEVIKTLSAVVSSIAVHVATELEPALTSLANAFIKSDQSAGLFKQSVTVIADVLKGLVTVVAVATEKLLSVGRTIGAVAAIAANWHSGGTAEILDQLNKDNAESTAQLVVVLKNLWDADQDFNANLQKSGDEDASKYKRAADGATAAEAALKKLTAVQDEYNKKIAAFAGDGVKDPLGEITERLNTGDLAKDLALIGKRADEMKASILAAAASLNELTLAESKTKFRNVEGARQATAEFDANTKLAKEDTKTDVTARQAQTDFSNTGASPNQIFTNVTKGFTDFNDALATWTTDTKMAAAAQLAVGLDEQTASKYAAEAARLKAEGDTAGAAAMTILSNASQAAAVEAQAFADSTTLAAAAALKAQDAFAKSAAEASASFHSMMGNWQGTLNVAAGAFLSKMGDIGTTIQAGISGFSQGGIWGAFVAVLAQFITRVKGWTEIMNIGNGQFQLILQRLESGIDNLLNGLKYLMDISQQGADTIGQIINPILGILGIVLKALAPIFSLIGVMLQPLIPILNIIGSILSGLSPIFSLLSYTLVPVVETILAFQLALDGVWYALEDFVNWIDGFFGGNNNGGVQDAQNAIDATIAQMAQMASLTKDANGNYDVNGPDLNNTPFDQIAAANDAAAKAANANANATTSATSAITKMTASLTNVPNGVKIALDTFNAIATGAGSGKGSPAGLIAGATTTPIMITNLTIQTNDLNGLHKQLAGVTRKLKFVKNGIK